MNRTEKGRIRSAPAIAILLLLVLNAGYPLSGGPACLYFRLSGETDATSRAITNFYKPLRALPEPAQRLFRDWCMLWYELPGNQR